MAKTPETIIADNFNSWNEALQTGDPEKVAGLYSPDATFLPTVSGKFNKDQKGTAEYFKHFLELNPTGEIVDEEIQPLGDETILHSGLYNFQVVSEGEQKIVKARFTFVWQKNKQGEWKIIHHHSSVKPEE